MFIFWLTFGAIGTGMMIIGFAQNDHRYTGVGGLFIALVITSIRNRIRGRDDLD